MERHAVDRPRGHAREIHEAVPRNAEVVVLVFFFLMAMIATERWPTDVFAHCYRRGAGSIRAG